MMRSLLVVTLLLAALIAIAGCGGSSNDPSGEFTTLSYNVAGLPQEVSQVNPKDHIPYVNTRG